MDRNYFKYFRSLKLIIFFLIPLAVIAFSFLIYNFSFTTDQNSFQLKFNSSFLQKTSLTNKVSYQVSK